MNASSPLVVLDVNETLSALSSVPAHADVADGVRSLHGVGARVVTFTNGAAEQSAALCERAGIADLVDTHLLVQDSGRWKPHPAAYAYCLDTCGTRPADAWLVAVHPWDLDGAHRAGMRTAWVDRAGAPYPGVLTSPDARCAGFADVAAAVTGAR